MEIEDLLVPFLRALGIADKDVDVAEIFRPVAHVPSSV
jgi:hypothetical protein